VQSLKIIGVNYLILLGLKNVDILYFTEHWLKEEHSGSINTDHSKLVSTFSRISSPHGGCICVKEHAETKDQTCLKELCKQKE
jgi:hypothetical protein